MDKKAKKRLEVLRQKLQKQEKLLAAAKQQTDEPDEITTVSYTHLTLPTTPYV